MSKANIQILILSGIAAAYAAPSSLSRRLDNGLAITPPMGWDSYNHYSCSPNQSVIQSNAKALVDLGLADLGYHYVITDCGWTIPTRTANGTLTWNPDRFPDGFPALGKYIHDLGLGFGVYSDAGVQMCMTGQPNQTGSLGHEQTDADTFASWGADLLKYDNCYSSEDLGFPDTDYTPSTSPEPRFDAMKKALESTGRKILYQICEWGVDFPSAWAPAIGNSWRITNDIIPQWRTIFRILNQFVPSASVAGPGQWPDLDMLEVGNDIFTEAEEQTHFSLWAIAKSPLVIGGRLKDTMGQISASSLAILSNKNVIGYNQDSLGKAAELKRRYTDAGLDVWSGPLSGGRTIVAMINWNNEAVDAVLSLPDVGVQSAGSALDVWANKPLKNIKTSYTANIAAHGTLLLELSDTKPAGTYPATMFATSMGDTTTFSSIYGLTDSDAYTLEITTSDTSLSSTLTITTSASPDRPIKTTFPRTGTITLQNLALRAGTNNTITISSATHLKITSLTITLPPSTFHGAPDFTVAGGGSLYNCNPTTLCAPVGAKIIDISPTSKISLSIPAPNATYITQRYVEVTYINNDIATTTSWTTGTNSRNLTIAVNGAEPVRLEVPLSGRSSELYSPMKGWGDSAVLGVLAPGFGTGKDGKDEIVVGNAGGEGGVQPLGADFVGLRVF